MAHQYASFATAYTALVNTYDDIRQWLGWSDNAGQNAWDAAESADWENAIKYCVTAIYQVRAGITVFFDLYSDDYQQSHFMESVWWGNKDVAGGDVTMSAILSAMISADEEEYQYFIGIVDAYRVALWNNPFNAEFYAAIARGFTL